MQPHLDLACAKLNNTQEELKICQGVTRNLAVRAAELENQLKQFQTTLDTLSLRIDNGAVEMEGKVDDVKDRVETVETILTDVVESKTKDMEECPEYIWPVTDFWEKVRRAKNGKEVRIESDTFYLGLHGYKMKLRMYPNGIRQGKNAYISIFLVLMKGKYDAILPWPFPYEVKFTIIDQNPDLKQRKNFSDSLGLSPSMETLQRPKFEENSGQGLNAFLSHKELRKSFYMAGETLFIKFEASRCKSV